MAREAGAGIGTSGRWLMTQAELYRFAAIVRADDKRAQPAPAAQRQWVELTDEGRKVIYDECQGLDVMKAIIQTEAKLKEKNT